MSNYPTIVNSYSGLIQTNKGLDEWLAPTLVKESTPYPIDMPLMLEISILKASEFAVKTACVIGIVTAAAMPVEATAAPSHIDLYPSVSEHINFAASKATFPQGYEIVNDAEIASYFVKHPYLKDFLQSNLINFQRFTGTENLALEYDGMKEEEWENLYLIVRLENNDDAHIDSVEEALFNEWLNNEPPEITNNLTISFA